MMHRKLMPIGLMSIIGVIAFISMLQLLHAPSAVALAEYPYPTSTVDIITPTPTDVTLTETPNISATFTETATSTAVALLNHPSANLVTEAQTPTMVPDEAIATPIQLAPPEVIRCSPNAVHLLTGKTTPETQLLLKFGTRVVGGGTSDSNGFFAIPLKMGKEPQGNYAISVVTRFKQIVVANLPCVVP